MDGKKRQLSEGSDISDENINALLGPEESPVKHVQKKTCLDDTQRNPTLHDVNIGSQASSGDRPMTSKDVKVDYKPLVGSHFRIPKKVIKRCGECSTCIKSDCGSCDKCKLAGDIHDNFVPQCMFFYR